MAGINPFRPNVPITAGMFVGRDVEVSRLEAHLLQTRAGKPTNFLLTGERGIGKSSLMNYVKAVALGRIELAKHGRLNFLVLDVSVDSDTTLLGLIAKIQLAMERALGATEPVREFMKKAWSFMQRVEAAGVKIGAKDAPRDLDARVFEEFCYSLGDTANRVCDVDQKNVFEATYDGVLLLIDEADNAPDDLPLGMFLKGLTERHQKMGCHHFLIGLAGLPHVREVLRKSHQSSVRIFEELELDRLTTDEVARIIAVSLAEAGKDNEHDYYIESKAEEMLIALAEGYPHFIQQFGFSAFESDSDYTIDAEDVKKGATGKHGALTQIGDSYYRDDLTAVFGGDNEALRASVDALLSRGLIVLNDAKPGVIGLQHRGFAFWIKMQGESADDLFAALQDSDNDDTYDD
jgi:hypothetical protein